MIEFIDYEKRLTCEEHIVLLYYSLMYKKKHANYSEFQITELLIDEYNLDNNQEKRSEVEKMVERKKEDLDKFRVDYAQKIWDYEKPVIWSDTLLKDLITNVSNGDTEVQKLFGGKKYFDYPKSVDLLKILIGAVKDKDALILDFFSGSATTAHATMQLNREDGGNRQYIMVQIPDGIDEKSEAYKDGYHNLCEIGKERIRLAGAEIKEADIGFRVLKLDSSNMKDIYYNPAQIQQQSLFDSTDNIKEDRTPEDLLFQVMLDLGILLSSKIEEKTIAGKKVFNVADGFLIACFDNDVTEKTVKAVAQEKPYYAVFRDSSMANDSVATNFEQIFATYSPETVRKVL